MSTVTLPISAVPKRAAAEPKGWFARAFDRMIEARMRQAERQIREHLHHLPPEMVERANYKDSVGEKWALPFVRGA